MGMEAIKSVNTVNFKGYIDVPKIYDSNIQNFKNATNEQCLQTYDDAIKMIGYRAKLAADVAMLINNDPEIKEKLSNIPANYAMGISTEIAGPGSEFRDTSPIFKPTVSLFDDEDNDFYKELSLPENTTINDLQRQISSWLDTLPKAKGKQSEELTIEYTNDPKEVASKGKLLEENLKKQRALLKSLFGALESDTELQESISNLPDDYDLNIMGGTCIFKGGNDIEEFTRDNAFYPLYLFHSDFVTDKYPDIRIDLPITKDGELDVKSLAQAINNIKKN